MQDGICTCSSQHASINTIEFVHRAVKLTVCHQWIWSIPSRYGNLFCVAQSISHIVNAAVSQTNNLQNPIWTSTVSSQWLRKKAWGYAKVWTALNPPPPTAITVDKQLDGSQGNCPESWHRLCIICWQNCQWVNDHGQLAESPRFNSALPPFVLAQAAVPFLSPSLPFDGSKNTNKEVSDNPREGGYLHLMCEFTSTEISAVWRLN